MRLLVAVCVTLLFTYASPSESEELRIFNVSQGLARMDGEGKWTIYQEGNTFVLRTNGDCVAAGERKKCMWYAVAFDFSAPSDRTILTCTSRSSEPVDYVTPRGVQALQAREYTYSSALSGRTGKIVWPGYSIADGTPGSRTNKVACEHDGVEVLTFEFTITEQPNGTVERDARKNGARPSP